MSQADRSHTTRRTLLAGAAAFTTAVGISLTASAAPLVETPIARLYRQAKAIEHAANHTPMSDDERDRLMAENVRCLSAIAAQRSTSLSDLRIKARIVRDEVAFFATDEMQMRLSMADDIDNLFGAAP